MDTFHSLLLILFLSLFSCADPEPPAIGTTILSVNPEKQTDLKFSDIFEELDYITLKTGGIPLGNIRKLQIEDDKIFLWDGQANSILIFDMSGNLQFTINRSGRGEGEYSGMTDFAFDPGEQVVYLLDRAQMKMIRCKLDGEFINEFELPKEYFRFALLGNDQLVLYAGNTLSYKYHYKILDILTSSTNAGITSSTSQIVVTSNPFRNIFSVAARFFRSLSMIPK